MASASKVYIVQGETGEHADRSVWTICAHRTLEGAHFKKSMFETWATLNNVLQDNRPYNLEYERLREARDSWKKIWPDYNFTIDYNGLLFDVVELEYDPDEQIPGSGVV